jgi:glycerol-3-phosphate acyltransferase PlsY
MSAPEITIYFVLPICGYLLGSIPFAFVIGKLHGVDIRTVGSKNIGATNLGRTLGKKYFWQAFLLDAAKGFVPMLVASLYQAKWRHMLGVTSVGLLGPNMSYVDLLPSWSPLLTGTACVLGHLFPVWLKFKGGKGVATGFGVVLGFWPLYTLAGLIGGAFFVFMLMVYRTISLASMTSSIVFVAAVAYLGMHDLPRLPTALPWNQHWPLIAVAALFSLMIILRHRANIARLLKGTEPKIGQREIDKSKM